MGVVGDVDVDVGVGKQQFDNLSLARNRSLEKCIAWVASNSSRKASFNLFNVSIHRKEDEVHYPMSTLTGQVHTHVKTSLK